MSAYSTHKKQITLGIITILTGLLVLLLANSVNAQAAADDGRDARSLPTTGSTTGYWQFDDGAGVAASNSVSATHTATLNGGVSWSADTATLGTSNPFAISLDGIDDYVEIADDNSIDFDTQQDFTVAVWVKPGVNSDSEEFIVDKSGVSSAFPYSVRYVPATGAVSVSRSDGTNTVSIQSTALINDGNYHHITLVRSGGSSGTLNLYIDGTLDGSSADTTTTTTVNAEALRIGRNNANHFAGTIDDLRIYNQALSLSEIRALVPAATCGPDGYLPPYTINPLRPDITRVQLRRAIACANLSNSAATIDINNQHITFFDSYPTAVGNTSLPDIMTPITLTNGTVNRGHGHTNTFRHFHVTGSGDLTLRNMSILRGNPVATSATDQYGGAIYVNGGQLLIEDSRMNFNVIAGTTYGAGGAIAATNGATVTVNNSFIGTGTARHGGGIYSENSAVTINSSTLSGNNAPVGGGALFNRDGQLTLNHATLYNNSAFNGSTLVVSSTTTAPQTTFNNTLIANTNVAASADCVQTVAPSAPQPVYQTPGNNIDRDGTCATLAAVGFTTHADAGLSTNAWTNRFGVAYYPLQSNSPAINAGNNASVPSDALFQFDVRGAGNPRIVADTVDIGAHEYDKFGRITILKAARPADGTDFTFNSTLPTATTFTLDTIAPQDGDAHSDRLVVNNVLAGAYAITETVPANWSLGAATCFGTANPATINGATLTVTLGESEDALCVFTNTVTPTGNCQVEVNGDNVTDFSSADGSALQTAVDAASAGDILKVAGTCAGVQTRNGQMQTVYVDKSLTLLGGFNANNWLAAPNPTANPTTINANKQGRGIYATQTKLTVRDMTIVNGQAADGGGIYLDRTVTTLDNVTVIASSATQDGGGVYQANGSTTLRNVTVWSNEAGRYGGGFAAAGGHFAIEQGSEFAYNRAVTRGGGVYSDSASQWTLDSSTLRYNGSQDGGGLYNDGYGGLLITNSTIEHNIAADEGGGAYVYADAVIENSTIANNRAAEGGGIYEYAYGNVIIRNSMVLTNTATADGGGFYLNDDGGAQIYQSIFRNNQATSEGGGIYVYEESGLIVEDSAFDSNSADDGGAIFMEDDSSIQVERTTFHSNRAADSGGAIYLDDTSGNIRSSTFSGNRAGSNGGAIFAYYYAFNLQNNTIVDNEAGTAGGGLYVDSNTSVALQNNILAGNRVAGSFVAGSADCSTTALNANFLSIGGNLFGTNTGCIVTRFDQAIAGDQVLTTQLESLADNGGVTLPDGTRPQTHNVRNGSSAVDFADNAFCPTADQRGTARPAGNRCDSGAVESSFAAFTGSPGNIIFVSSTDNTVTVDGNCTLREAILAANTDTTVDACKAGSGWDLIYLNAGTYTLAPTFEPDLDSDLDIASPIIIQGADTATTIINGNQAGRVFDVNGAALRLQNLTITNGQTSANGGCVYNNDGFLAIENSVVTSCATQGSGDGGAVHSNEGIFYLLNATVSQNVSADETGGLFNNYGVMVIEQGNIFQNSAQDYGGGAQSYYGSTHIVNTQIQTNTATSNHSGGLYAYVGVVTMDNSQIQSNVTPGNGGGVGLAYGAFRVRNSTIRLNSTGGRGGGIFADHGLWIDSSTIERNSASAEAGGLFGATLVTSSTIRNNSTPGSGGGLISWGVLRNVDVSSNSATQGGGIYGWNTMLYNSAVYGNSANVGAGIALANNNRGVVYLQDSTVHNNGGGGVYASTASNGIVLRNSTLHGNSGSFSGGGIYSQQGVVDALNSTISGNEANSGGGVAVISGTLSLDFTTVANNTAATGGGGVYNGSGAATVIENSIVAGNVNSGGAVSADCQASNPIQFAGHSVFGSATGCTSTNSNDATVDPATVFTSHLAPLADNGGATTPAGNVLTHDVLALSNALDWIPLAHCGVSADQRSATRPYGSACDAGAVESQTFQYTMVVDDGYVVNENNALVINNTATGLLGNDNARAGKTLNVVNSGLRNTTNGTVSLQANGTFHYSPNTNFSGTDTFTYTVSDGVVQNNGVVTITVTPQSTQIALVAGWNNFGYPLQGSRAINDALISITGVYTTVWNYDAPTTTWRRYTPSAPSWTNTLSQLEYAKAYWIQMQQPATLTLTSGRGVVGGSQRLSIPTPPSAFYGTVTPAGAGQTVRALIGGVECGTATTFTQNGQTSYNMNVVSADERAGCGTQGATITFQVDSSAVNESGSWDTNQVQELNLTLAPTAVVLNYFTATYNDGNGSVIVDWQTASEVDHAGFNIYRRNAITRDAWTQINSSLLASRGSQAQGATYQFVDATVTEGEWEYLLEDVETDGDTYRHLDAVVTVTVGSPTAVSLTANQAGASGVITVLAQVTMLLLVTVGASVGKVRHQSKPAYTPPVITSYNVEELAQQLGPARAHSSGRSLDEEFLFDDY